MSNTDLLSGTAGTGVSQTAPGAEHRDSDQHSAASDAQAPTPNGSTPPKRRAGLSGMVLAELRALAAELGISSTAGMRKGDLIAAIKQRQGGPSSDAAQLPLGDSSAGQAASTSGPGQARG
ncbi:MAG: Rho termination factor N-terminal domain-containing protein, partial [Sciscionella sp.]